MATDVPEDASNTFKLNIKFIETYEACPELWDPRHEHYTNKHRRIQSQEKLLEVLRQIRPNATRVDVRAKINSMRSNYNKISAKAKAAKAAGIEYVTYNLMYHKLRFLDAVKRQEQTKKLTEDDESDNDETEASHHDDIRIKSPSTPTMVTEYVEIEENPQVSSIYLPSPEDVKNPIENIKIGNRKVVKRLQKHNFQTHRSPRSIQLYNNSSTTAIEPIAVLWSLKLQALDPKERLLAEKAINDILFEAEMKTLHQGKGESGSTEYATMEAGFGLGASEEYLMEYSNSSGEEDEK